MHLERFYLPCLAQASYLLADETSRKAVVVDPRRDIQIYLDHAARHGFDIEDVFLTHFHADFLAGHLELRDACGARIHLGAGARADYEFIPERDGTRHVWGDLALQVVATPGHTPESICLLVFDLARDHDQPQAVLTGDTLFVGDVGRPDLMASVGVSAEELAGMLYDSLHGKLMTLPDATLVHPGHGAGSMCGKSLGTESFTTIGDQRRLNPALAPMSREAFIAMATADLPAAPAYFSYAAGMNRRERPGLDQVMARRRVLALDDFLALLAAERAQIVDSRPTEDFVRGHLPGSINLPLDGRFAVWAGTVLDLERPILVVARPGEEDQTAMRLGRIGLDRVLGHLAGLAELGRADGMSGSWERLDSAQLERALAGKDAPLVLDVRSPAEWAAGHIPGARNLPVAELRRRLAELPRDREIVTTCQTGYRSALAASLLRSLGIVGVRDQRGGWVDWQATIGSGADEGAGGCAL
ncbi:MAG: MBL fold metallo-hydrolase [Planctomycetes bacterium]|nr:MBL fold metallo-hydrolase [Planctomycetota bacterium]